MAPGDDGPRASDQPAVRAWLARLDTESAGLPEDRRTELRSSVEDYLADVARAAGPDGARAAERALADLGPPEALVAEAGGYALAPAEPLGGRGAVADAPIGPPWLEAATLALLAASVVLALVPATEAFAPVPWFLGTLLVLLSRRWSVGDKALAVLAFGVMGVPFILLGRDELPTSMSLVVSVLLVAGWVAAAARLLVRAQSPREQGFGLRMR